MPVPRLSSPQELFSQRLPSRLCWLPLPELELELGFAALPIVSFAAQHWTNPQQVLPFRAREPAQLPSVA